MYKYIFNFLIIYLIAVNLAFAEINTIDNFVPLEQAIKRINQDTLVIFDVDHVLIMPNDDYTKNRHPYRQFLWQQIVGRNSKQKINMLQSIVTSTSKWCIIDPKIVNILAYLKKNLIPSVALTSYGTGKQGVIGSLEDLRVQQLKNLGIDFVNLSPIKGEVLINKLKNEHGIPMFKDGIIFTAELDKAIILNYILVNKNYHPKQIIFIDDQLNNLKSIENFCTKSRIKFYGFHYIAVSKKPICVIDKDKERMRFKILEKEHRWLSSIEVNQLKTTNRKNFN